MRKKVFLVFIIILAVANQWACAEPIKIGNSAPDFTLTDLYGTEHKLSDFSGKFVVLEWFNYDCPFVVKHYSGGNMQNLQKEYTTRDVIWLSINSSAPGKQGHYTASQMLALATERKSAPTAILLDPDGVVGKMYQAKTTPHMYIVNPEGLLVYRGAIDNKRSADPRDIAEAHNYVKATLDSALTGESIKISETKPYGCSVKY